MTNGVVIAVSKSSTHTFHKFNCDYITLIKGLGIDGDAHKGTTVKHRSRVAQDPNQPNLRQVHLIHAELHAELQKKGFLIKPGEMGENITTVGVSLLDLPKGAILKIGPEAVIEITGLRNPCNQLNLMQKGLMQAVLDTDDQGNLIRKAGVMGVVLESGEVKPGDDIKIVLPEPPFVKLDRM